MSRSNKRLRVHRASQLRRRAFLQALGVSTVPLFLGGLTRPAYAASPKRVVFVYVSDGVIPAEWHATGGETAFVLPKMSAPLEKIRNDCVFLKGVNMYGNGLTHEGGVRKALTGNADQSLDVFLGSEIGSETLHKSVQLGVASQLENGSGYVSLVGPEQFIEPEDNPLAAFQSLFGSIDGGDGQSDAEKLRIARDLSVLDTALADIQELESRLGLTEKQKLALHLESVREIEKRIKGDVGGACDKAALEGFNPTGYEHTVPPYYPLTYHEEARFPLMGGLQMDLVRLALSCDVTRVMTLQWSHPVSPTRVPGVSAGYHDASHMWGQPFIDGRVWFMERFVELIELLRSVNEEDGTLLDNTIVFLVTDVGDSDAHDHVDIPFVLAGGKNLGLAGGRFLDYSGKNGGENEPHNKILVSIANALGVAIESYGYTGHGTGGLSGLFS